MIKKLVSKLKGVEGRFAKLRRFNLIMSGLHAVQALAMILIAKSSYKQAITTNYVTYNSLTQHLEPAMRRIFDVPFVWLIVGFLMLSSLAHMIVATVYRPTYEKDLENGINKARWIEYSLSASTMMVAIGILAGISDMSTLIMMFVLTAGMNLMGLVMEIWNQKSEKVNWLSYWIGCLLGITPWIVFVIYLWGSAVYGGAHPPTFVYYILFSIFLMFNCFAGNMYLQYRRVGKWADYLYGERAYIILSLVAKSLLAWQVFSGVLKP